MREVLILSGTWQSNEESKLGRILQQVRQNPESREKRTNRDGANSLPCYHNVCITPRLRLATTPTASAVESTIARAISDWQEHELTQRQGQRLSYRGLDQTICNRYEAHRMHKWIPAWNVYLHMNAYIFSPMKEILVRQHG